MKRLMGIKRLMKFKRLMILMMLMLFMSKVEAVNLNVEEERLICALSSMAAYEDSNGVFVRDVLRSYKWNINQIVDENKVANEKLLIIDKRFDDGSLIKIISISGTKDVKDAEVDFRLKTVQYKSGNGNVLVHQGFNDYAELILSKGFGESLISELKSNPNEKIYLTGHSLGGAVALLMATKLNDLGADMNRIKVITFGSPAVGNREFVDEYKDKIKLTRVTVSNDPIKKSLQGLGYVHFGEAFKFEPSKTINGRFPHKMVVYLDCALRDYYKTFEIESKESTKKILIQINKNFADGDKEYIIKAMKNEIRRRDLQSEIYVREVEDVEKTELMKDITVYNLIAQKIKEDKDSNYRITLEEIKYDESGMITSMQTSSITTKELTTLEAVIYTQMQMGGK